MKYYLLIVGHDYYPGEGTDDWQGCFETLQEARDHIIKSHIRYDWYKIVDLMGWIRK